MLHCFIADDEDAARARLKRLLSRVATVKVFITAYQRLHRSAPPNCLESPCPEPLSYEVAGGVAHIRARHFATAETTRSPRGAFRLWSPLTF